ncbi:MAG: hypothetical protein QXO25_04080 [Candidatus Bathyarchaeia archaeon]
MMEGQGAGGVHCGRHGHFIFSARKMLILPGVILLAIGLLLLPAQVLRFAAVLRTLETQFSISALLFAVFHLNLVISSILSGLVLTGLGVYLHFFYFRRQAESIPLHMIPTVPSQYYIRMEERVEVQLDVSEGSTSYLQINSTAGHLTISVPIDRNTLESHQAYEELRRRYGWRGQNPPFDFGFVVLDMPGWISIQPGLEALGQSRNVYRMIAQEIDLAAIEIDEGHTIWQALLQCGYTFFPDALRFGEQEDARGRGVVWIVPMIEPLSAGRVVHFVFDLPDEIKVDQRLRKLVLRMSPAMFGEEVVEFPVVDTNGQSYPEQFEIQWNDWPLEGAKWPSVTFAQDVTHMQKSLQLTFEIEINKTLSGAQLLKEHLWLPSGTSVTSSSSIVVRDCRTRLIGNVRVDPSVFFYQYEHTRTDRFEKPGTVLRPELVRDVIQALTDEGVSVKSVLQGEPAIEVRDGAISKSTWDILGRYYTRIYPIDLHVLLSERRPLEEGTDVKPCATVQLTVRALLSSKTPGMREAVDGQYERFLKLLKQVICKSGRLGV